MAFSLLRTLCPNFDFEVVYPEGEEENKSTLTVTVTVARKHSLIQEKVTFDPRWSTVAVDLFFLSLPPAVK
jgi:hypothetical protein